MQADCVISEDSALKNVDTNLDKRRVYLRILNIVLPVAAYGFLIYKLATYDNYAAMVGHFQTADVEQYFCLLLAFCLFPLNVGLDGFRWRYMLRRVEPMTLWDANRQVYYGFLGAFLTPYRMGDYPTRAMLFHNPGNWHMALAYGGVTAFATTMVIVLSGLPSAFVFFSQSDDRTPFWIALGAAIGLTIILSTLPLILRKLKNIHYWRSDRMREVTEALAGMRMVEFLFILLQTLCRYLCFMTQFYLVLRFTGIELGFTEALVILPTYYMLITLTPYVPAAEIGIRGSWAMVVFGYYSHEMAASAALAAVLVWVINTIPPMIIGSLVRKHD